MRKWLGASAALACALTAAIMPRAMAAGPPSGPAPACTHPVLILSAMPLELNPLIERSRLDATVHVDDKTFYAGRLAGVPVVMALTGIGPANATRTSTLAFEHFRCSFAATLFDGVAGSPYDIGDVVVPTRWTLNAGKTFVGTDPAMAAVAARIHPKLEQDLPLGDPACLCGGGAPTPTPVHLPATPRVRVGGSGQTTDPFGGFAAPCVWAGGDIAGCEPCVLSGNPARDAANFSEDAPRLIDPRFIEGLLNQPAEPPTFVAADEETAAVDTVARRYGVPFLGIRAVSDGKGDPLGLPGFPAQFFVYRQLAGDNAATVTVAFLRAWNAAGRPIAH